MSSYFIKYIQNSVSVFEYEDHELNAVRYKGEDSWEFQESSFWSWFKEKAEYADEELSFIILCDSPFKIDESIHISSKHNLSQQKIEDILYDEDFSQLDILIFPNDYKVKDIVSSMQSNKQAEKQKSDKIKALYLHQAELKKSLAVEQNTLKEIEQKKITVLREYAQLKEEYFTKHKNTIDNFTSKILPAKSDKLTLQVLKFALVYAQRNLENATKQASNLDMFITIDKIEEVINEQGVGFYSFIGQIYGNPLPTENSKSKSTTKSTKTPITLKENKTLTIEGDVDGTDILNHTEEFFKTNFSSLKPLYKKFQQEMDRLNHEYLHKILKVESNSTNKELAKLTDNSIFTKNILFSKNILKITSDNLTKKGR